MINIPIHLEAGGEERKGEVPSNKFLEQLKALQHLFGDTHLNFKSNCGGSIIIIAFLLFIPTSFLDQPKALSLQHLCHRSTILLTHISISNAIMEDYYYSPAFFTGVDHGPPAPPLQARH